MGNQEKEEDPSRASPKALVGILTSNCNRKYDSVVSYIKYKYIVFEESFSTDIDMSRYGPLAIVYENVDAWNLSKVFDPGVKSLADLFDFYCFADWFNDHPELFMEKKLALHQHIIERIAALESQS